MRNKRSFWLLGFIALWIIGVFLLFVWSVTGGGGLPAKKKQEDEQDQNFLKTLDLLQNNIKSNSNKFSDLNKDYIVYLRQKFEKSDEPQMIPDGFSSGLAQLEQLRPTFSVKIPVLVFACNRVSISKCLDNLIQYRPDPIKFPIIVSQDCGDEATKNMILSYGSNVTLIEQPDLSNIPVPPKEKKFKGYYKIARHYGWALNTVFNHGFEYVIIVEDDLNVAPDFYEYFLSTYPLLKKDPSLWCVSAWNDNGKVNLIDTTASDLLYRSDFFPGLGWMLTRYLWEELSPKWPKAFWDDWIRHPEQRKGRACIRPEISRTRTFGKIGVSNGLFFEKHLKYIKLSEDYVNFSGRDLSFLLKEQYDDKYLKDVYECPVVTYEELRRNMVATKGPVRIQYNTREQYKSLTKIVGLMDDFKSGVPRTGYHGIVSFFFNGQRVYLAPNINWKGYDLSWS